MTKLFFGGFISHELPVGNGKLKMKEIGQETRGKQGHWQFRIARPTVGMSTAEVFRRATQVVCQRAKSFVPGGGTADSRIKLTQCPPKLEDDRW